MFPPTSPNRNSTHNCSASLPILSFHMVDWLIISCQSCIPCKTAWSQDPGNLYLPVLPTRVRQTTPEQKSTDELGAGSNELQPVEHCRSSPSSFLVGYVFVRFPGIIIEIRIQFYAPKVTSFPRFLLSSPRLTAPLALQLIPPSNGLARG